MKTTYQVLMPTGPIGKGEVDWPAEPHYQQIKALCEPIIGMGEPLERVSVMHNGKRTDMIVSEVGHLRLTTRAPLPINPQATQIYRASLSIQYRGDPDLETTIAGIAILFDRRIWF